MIARTERPSSALLRRAGLAAALVGVALASGCGGGDAEPGVSPTAGRTTDGTSPPGAEGEGATTPAPGEYRAGRAASVALPAAGAPEVVVVVVPGGGWSTADPRGFAPLADAIVAEGMAAVTITYGTSGTGDSYPGPVDDVRCAIAFAAAQVPDVPVVVLGHSAGAHLAALAALSPVPAEPGCPWPDRAADAVVGLAGPYDVNRAGGIAENLFGSPQGEDLEMWVEGNPLTWVAERPEVPFLLLHGEFDSVVPEGFTDDLVVALTDAGHDVTAEVLPGVDHGTIVTPEVVLDPLVRWVEASVVASASS